MSDVDDSLHTYTFSPWADVPTRYAADTADFGDDVDDAWKELGVYDKLMILPAQYGDAYNISAKRHYLVTKEDHDVPYSGFPVNLEAFHHVST